MSRPDSMKDWPDRIVAFVEATEEHPALLAEEAGVRVEALTSPGPMPNARTVLAIDRLAYGHLLDPPEREWAHDTIRRYNQKWGIR